MLQQLILRFKYTATSAASEQLLGAMSECVAAKVAWVGKGTGTVWTLVRFLACVCPQVSHHVVGALGSIAAHLAQADLVHDGKQR